MKSPFKFLDPYTAADRDVFFGREEEVAALYDMVLKNRLILIYGQSGTGKTSLIQCGLASRFDATDWLPVFIRRHDDLNRSMADSLAKILGDTRIESPAAAISEIYFQFLRPVYLVFDQLEELFILGGADEQHRFVQSMRELLDSGTPCRILFVMREEYLAHLYGFERVIPTLFDRRLRVEPMVASRIKKVLEGSFEQYNIGVQAPESETYSLIVDQVSGEKAVVQLPYLQVYLDMLYREDFIRTYPGAEPGADGKWQRVVFTREEVKALGKIGEVLERFLVEQQTRLTSELNLKTGGKTADEETEDPVKKVLDAFVSEEGTKRPIAYRWKGDLLIPDEHQRTLFEPLEASMVSRICRELEKARLLRFGDTHIELAHDALAAIIDGQRTAQQRRLRDAQLLVAARLREALHHIQNRREDYKISGFYLSRRELNHLEDLMPMLEARLSPEAKRFLQESREYAEALEKAELLAERKKRKQARRVAAAGLGLAVLALAGFFTALSQYRAAARNAAEARRNFATSLKVEGKYDRALEQLAAIQPVQGVLGRDEIHQIEQTRSAWNNIRQLVREGDSLKTRADFRNAIDRYEAARKIEEDGHLTNLVEQSKIDLEAAYQKAMLDGQILSTTSGALPRAVEKFEQALRLKPDDANAAAWLEKCRNRGN